MGVADRRTGRDRLTALVVDDCAELACRIRRALAELAQCDVVHTVGAAIARLQLQPYELLLVDVHLPDGCGFGIAKHARKRQPKAALVIVTGDASTETNHRAFGLDAQILLKPFSMVAVVDLAKRVLDARNSADADLKGRVAAFARQHRLSGRETEAIQLAVCGVRQTEIALALGVAESTVKTLLARVRKKASVRCFAELASEVWSTTSEPV